MKYLCIKGVVGKLRVNFDFFGAHSAERSVILEIAIMVISLNLFQIQNKFTSDVVELFTLLLFKEVLGVENEFYKMKNVNKALLKRI